MRTVFAGQSDVEGPTYGVFITALVGQCATFSLVWNDQHQFDDSAELVAAHLRHLQVDRYRATRWPATELFESQATIIRYRCDETAISVLCRPGSLFSWRAPKYPEDLAFYDSTGDAVVASVAHESYLWVLDATLRNSLQGTVQFEAEEVDDPTWRNLNGVA